MADYSSNALAATSSDPYSGLFEPDVVVPSQFLGKGKLGLSGGERKLMAALLSDGIEAYIAYCAVPKQVKRRNALDAREWVETKDYSYVFSFDNVCECLGIDPDYLRLGLKRYLSSTRDSHSRGSNPRAVWKKIRRPRKQ